MPTCGWRMSNKTFTDKHRELFPCLAQGKTNSEIADILGIKPPTVHQRVNSMIDIIKGAERADIEQFCREVLAENSNS